MRGYIANWQNISYFYEGRREGSAYSFGVMTPKTPSLDSWLRFSALIDLTGGLHRDIMKIYSNDIVREIDRRIEKDRENDSRRAVLLIDDSRTSEIINSSGKFQEGEFDDNLSFMKVVSIGQIPKKDGKPTLRHIIGKPTILNVPHPLTVYRFRTYKDESNVIAERCMEMMNLGC